MAAHHLTIAKASFAASLMRPDVTKVHRDDLPRFHDLFESVVTACSPSNIQNCKQWLLDNVLISTQRTSAFGKYMTSFSKHTPNGEQRKRSISRQRLHAIYLLNDLLHHAKYHFSEGGIRSSLTQSIQPFLGELFHLAVRERKSRVDRRLQDLLKIWEDERYYSKDHLAQIRHGMSSNLEDIQFSNSFETKPAQIKELPFTMPPTHGDSALPFYELPAGNLMPHIIPNNPIPIRPESVRALQFSPGLPDEGLIRAVKAFLKEVESIDNVYKRIDDETIVADVDEMGQLSYCDEDGELVGDTYYGWSRTFCEKMKKRDKTGSDGLAPRGRSCSYSSSRSPSPRKRKRHSRSSSQRSISSRCYDMSRSRSRNGSGQRLRDDSPIRSHSRSLPQPFTPDWLPPRCVSSSDPVAPLQRPKNTPASSQQFHPQPIGLPPHPGSVEAPPYPPPPLGPEGMLVAPPRPPNWNGPWPPPPPPPPPQQMGAAFPGLGYPHSPPTGVGHQGAGLPFPPRSGHAPETHRYNTNY